MKMYAIMKPCGSFIPLSDDTTKAGAWDMAEGRDEGLDKAADGLRPSTLARRGEIGGYRCVEAELAELGTADALKRAREAWWTFMDGPPGTLEARINALNTLDKVLGRVTDNAAGEGGEDHE